MKITINKRQRQYVCDELEFQPLRGPWAVTCIYSGTNSKHEIKDAYTLFVGCRGIKSGKVGSSGSTSGGAAALRYCTQQL